MKFRRNLNVLRLQVLQKKFWAQFLELCVQKWSGLLWSSDAFWMFSPFKLYKISSGRIFPINTSKSEVVCRGVQTNFESSLSSSFIEKVEGAILQFVRPKTKLSAVKFRRILEVLCLQVLKKICRRDSTIYASKNETVCCEVQTLFGSSLPASFTESAGRNSTICASKNEAVCREIQTHSGSSLPASFTESSGRNSTICASKNETVCCEVQTHFGSSPPPRFTEKFLDKFLRFMCPKTKVFAVKFRPILQAHPLARLIKSCGRIFAIYVSHK